MPRTRTMPVVLAVAFAALIVVAPAAAAPLDVRAVAEAHHLHIAIVGHGVVYLGSMPCPETCDYDFDASVPTPIHLSASPALDSVFDHWEGACTGTQFDVCDFPVNEDKTATAVFVIPDPVTTVVVREVADPPGTGTRFGFHSTLPGLAAFALDGSAPVQAERVAQGAQQITQDPLTRGWELTELGCENTFAELDEAPTISFNIVPYKDYVVCTFTNTLKPLLTLHAAFGYSGGRRGHSIELDGVDRARITGNVPGLAPVGRICVTSAWNAKSALAKRTRTPIRWNGRALPFDRGRGVDEFQVGSRTARGYRGTFVESASRTVCAASPARAVRAAQAPLKIAWSGRLLSLRHRALVEIFARGGADIDGFATPWREVTGDFPIRASRTEAADL